MTTEEPSEFLHHEPCPSCGSSDNLARYTDGHGFCFGCNHYEHGDGEPSARPRQTRMAGDLITNGEFKALHVRGISEETCKKFGYRVATLADGRVVQVAPYYDAAGQLVAQKVRPKNKDGMFATGTLKEAAMFGQNLWGQGGKRVVVTEGEIDALSVSQMQGNKWPVVSVKNGASGAAKDFKRNLEWLESYDEVVIMFDMDDVGRKAAVECAEVLSPGKAKIATLPCKDANECLTTGVGDQIIQAIWNAKTYRPDGIVAGQELWDLVKEKDNYTAVPYPFDSLNAKTRGIRRGELVTITAGSGIGKSAFVREIAYHLINQGETVGMIMLEESVKRTALGLMGIALSRPIHLGVTDESEADLRAAFDATLGTGRVYLYDHFGSTEVENLVSRIRYLARSLDCGWVILDHLSIVVSGMGDGDERRLIDNAMTELRTLVQETGIGLILVSHLKRPSGDKGHEEGASTSLSQLRGSHAIAQLSDIVLGLERNQQGDAPDVTTVRVLKNRFTGETGEGCLLKYDRASGRLFETSKSAVFEDEATGDDPF